MPSQEVMSKYEDVRMSLEKALEASTDIQLKGEDENAELSYVKEKLGELNSDFKKEIERLENSSECDKYCIAFFGETNAGKSTIIEALRIVFDEKARSGLIRKLHLFQQRRNLIPAHWMTKMRRLPAGIL